MTLFVLQAIDRPGSLPARLEQYDAHRAFIETGGDQGVKVVLSGPLQSDDGETMIGSLFIIEAGSRAAVEAFVQADPFSQAKVWGDVSVHRFHRRKG